jgi:hypothetical protein
LQFSQVITRRLAKKGNGFPHSHSIVSRRLAGHVVDHAVDTLHLVHDAAGDGFQHLVRQGIQSAVMPSSECGAQMAQRLNLEFLACGYVAWQKERLGILAMAAKLK